MDMAGARQAALHAQRLLAAVEPIANNTHELRTAVRRLGPPATLWQANSITSIRKEQVNENQDERKSWLPQTALNHSGCLNREGRRGSEQGD